ncbi:DUF6588 family protein [Aurantibacter sp.]|uniref:DUF6588 family protein n=1 Tax=Aurantibacter sp. TaxID=2807103 RepID=UPI0035C84E74
MRKLFFILISLSGFSAQAQLNDINAVASDLIFLTEKYITPAAEAPTYQSSGGWYTNFTPKKIFEIEASLQYNLLLITNKNKTFLVNESELQNIQIQGSSTFAYIPTALGNDDVVVLEGSINGDSFEFDAPEGINEKTVKHGQLQASVGLWKQTNLIVRYAPNIKINDTNYQSFGFGVSHHLNQWIKSLKESSYHFGVLFNYSNTSVEDTFNAANLQLGTINGIAVDGETFGFNLVGSKSYKNFDFSSSLGLTSSKFDYKVSGTGELLLEILNQSLATLNTSKTNFKADFNVNYRFNNFSVNTMFTVGDYSNLNFGVNYCFNKRNVDLGIEK